MNWFVLGAVVVVTATNLKGIWQTRTLKKEGTRVNGIIIGSRQYKSNVTYKAKFTTLQGQVIEGESSGWRFTDAGYFIDEETTVIYDASDPTKFVLESEIGNNSIYGRAIMMIVLVAVMSWGLSHQFKH